MENLRKCTDIYMTVINSTINKFTVLYITTHKKVLPFSIFHIKCYTVWYFPKIQPQPGLNIQLPGKQGAAVGGA